MTAGDTQPTTPLPEWAYVDEPATKRSRAGWVWLVGILIVVALAIAAWFIGEAIARDVVTKTIRDTFITELSLPADQQVDVGVEGAVLPQVVAGTLTEVTLASENVTFGEITGDVTLDATGIAIRGETGAETASGTLSLDTAQLQTLLSNVDGFPVESVGLDEPDVTVSTELSVFGAAVPIGIALTPSAADGDLVLTPSALTLGGADIDAADLADRLGGLADGIVRDWDVCIARYIPAGVTLTSVAVEGDRINAAVDIDPAIIDDQALLENGTCS